MTLLRHPSERRRFYQFAFVGTLGAGVDLGTFNLLRMLTPLHPVVASVFSFLAAATHNFIWHRYWTFADSRSKSFWRQWSQFVFINAIGVSIRTPLFALLRWPFIRLVAVAGRWLPLPWSAERLGENLALGTVMLIVLFWNFFANRYWTYNDVQVGATAPPTRRPARS